MGLTSKSFKEVPRVNLRLETSWDDCYQEDLKIAKLLRQYGVKGTFFVTLNNVGEKGFLGWEEIIALEKDALFDIGSHTITHPMDLKTLYEDELVIEVLSSKEMLEAVFDKKITKFCYPRGRYDETVLAKVIESGYLEARTTKVGYVKTENPFEKHTTVHVFDGRKEYGGASWFEYALEMLEKYKKELNENSVFHLWGHSREVFENNLFESLEQFLRHIQTNYNLV
jgi:peptidoglycan/xylan/chitin deacetylase (PgdA/CDA1 family)